MLAGVGSLPIRTSISSLLVNFVQTLFIANASDPAKSAGLGDLLPRCSGKEILQACGLAKLSNGSDDYRIDEDMDESDAMEDIGKVLLDVIQLGSPDSGTFKGYAFTRTVG